MSAYCVEQALSCNVGIISATGQAALNEAIVAVAGCGGVGGWTAVELARLGVRRFRLADPDVVDLSNLNRQEGALMSTFGLNKSEVIATVIRDINPTAEVDAISEGITLDNAERFLAGASLVVEAIDYRQPFYTRLVHKVAQGLQLPLVTGVPVAWNAFCFFFDYRSPEQIGFDTYVGLDTSKAPGNELRSRDIAVTAFVPEFRLYLNADLIRAVLAEEIAIPCIGPAVSLVGAQTAALAYFCLSGTRKVDAVPRYYAVGDLFNNRSKKVPLWTTALLRVNERFRNY